MMRELSRVSGKKPKRQWMALAAFCCAFATTGAAELKTHWEYKEAGDFARISEFLTGKEAKGNRILLRSSPKNGRDCISASRLKGVSKPFRKGQKPSWKCCIQTPQMPETTLSRSQPWRKITGS